MPSPLPLIRVLGTVGALILGACCGISLFPSLHPIAAIAIGTALGGGFAFLLLGIERALRSVDLRTWGTFLIGLIVGLIAAQGVILLLDAALLLLPFTYAQALAPPLHAAVILLMVYCSMLATAHAADSVALSLPFIRLHPQKTEQRDILVDRSILLDSRIVEAGATGLFDQMLVVPRCIVSELQAQVDQECEESSRARRALSVLQRLEEMDHLSLRYTDMKPPKGDDEIGGMVHMARMLNARLLTAEINRIRRSSIDTVTVINIHTLANALKPIMETGETISLKIQRYGKEPRQGVGYLEDGSMVVVNSGGDYIGETIRCTVLSVKHTSSGRMIFCNVAEAGDEDRLHHAKQEKVERTPRKTTAGKGSSQRDYFTV